MQMGDVVLCVVAVVLVAVATLAAGLRWGVRSAMASPAPLAACAPAAHSVFRVVIYDDRETGAAVTDENLAQAAQELAAVLSQFRPCKSPWVAVVFAVGGVSPLAHKFPGVVFDVTWPRCGMLSLTGTATRLSAPALGDESSRPGQPEQPPLDAADGG